MHSMNPKFENRAAFKNTFGTISSLSLLNRRASPQGSNEGITSVNSPNASKIDFNTMQIQDELNKPLALTLSVNTRKLNAIKYTHFHHEKTRQGVSKS